MSYPSLAFPPSSSSSLISCPLSLSSRRCNPVDGRGRLESGHLVRLFDAPRRSFSSLCRMVERMAGPPSSEKDEGRGRAAGAAAGGGSGWLIFLGQRIIKPPRRGTTGRGIKRKRERGKEREREKARTAIVLDQSPGFVGEQPPKAGASQPAAPLRGEGAFSKESSG